MVVQAGNHSKPDFRVSRGTPFGDALRRHWIPACESNEIFGPDCDPIRLALLGDTFVAFRNSAGEIGILDEHCPHRRASLVYGRNENGGLRCLWHQWKFDIQGNILDAPNSNDCTLKDRVHATAYPVKESGGLVWVYLGVPSDEPVFRDFAWARVPDRSRAFAAVDLDCSYVKALEGSVDSAHVSLLHSDSVSRSPVARMVMTGQTAPDVDGAPVIEIENTDVGFYIASIRPTADTGSSTRQVTIAAFVAPFVCLVPPVGTAFICVPQDDRHCRLYNVKWFSALPFEGRMREQWVDFLGLDTASLEQAGIAPHFAPEGPLGARNHFIQDREGMRSGKTFSGLPGLTAEDAAMTCSVPGISEYEGEHLVPADLAVVRLRQHLWGLARQPAKPLNDTDLLSVHSGAGTLQEGDDWRELLTAPAMDEAVRLSLTSTTSEGR